MDFKENRMVKKDALDKFVDFLVDDIGGGIKSGTTWTGDSLSSLSDTVEDGWDNAFNPEPVALDDETRKAIQEKFPNGFKGSPTEKTKLYNLFIRSYAKSAFKLEAELNPILAEISRLKGLQVGTESRIGVESMLRDNSQKNSDRASRLNAINLPPSEGDKVVKAVYGSGNIPEGAPLVSPDKDPDWDKHKFVPKRKTASRFYFAGKKEEKVKDDSKKSSAPSKKTNTRTVETLSDIPNSNWTEYLEYMKEGWRDELADKYDRIDLYNPELMRLYYDIDSKTELTVIDDIHTGNEVNEIVVTRNFLMQEKGFVYVVDNQLIFHRFTNNTTLVQEDDNDDDTVIVAPVIKNTPRPTATPTNNEDMYDPVSDTIQSAQDTIVEEKSKNIGDLKNKLIRVFISDKNAITTINARLAGEGLTSALSTTQQMTLEAALNYLESAERIIGQDLSKYEANLKSARVRLEKMQERGKAKK